MRFLIVLASCFAAHLLRADELITTHLRCEYRNDPQGIDELSPRLSWRVESGERGSKQTAYQIRVASTREKLIANDADLWDSGKIDSSQTLHVVYSGKALVSRQTCHWSVRSWNAAGTMGAWSAPAKWSMGLMNEADWSGEYISYRDETPIATDTKTLFLPPARQYRKEFTSTKTVRRATIYATALGIYELHLNGARVSDHYFAPGWTDYLQRAYYNAYDVTPLVKNGDNAIGAWVADGWYSGYVGFGLLTGMGTEKMGRYTYGKTPALMTQLEIEYTDGSRETIGTDKSWKTTGEGPIREADLLMGETYDARLETPGWSSPKFDDSKWQAAILASENGHPTANFFDNHNPSEPNRGPAIKGVPRDLGFKRPKLEAFPGEPIRMTQEMPSKKVTERDKGTFVFDLGQNFAGVVRLKIKGPAGHQVKLRFGEMLHPDGRLMTENLRKARAQDFYTCRGDDSGEVFEPRFAFHGFQFVEVSNFPGTPTLETITGLVMHSDTPMTSKFTCSDPMANQLFKNVVWTQRANFMDLPTDCPQRDERMGWTGDAQAYIGTAAYNADIGAFYTKWLRELMESQRPSGAFPGYAPFPFQHGWDFGSAWADAGVICPWTMWQVYGDTRLIEECWEPMTRFMKWRKSTSQDDLGIAHGNAWGDWLAQGASTPLEYVDTVYYAISASMMADMATAIGRESEAKSYREQFDRIKLAFGKKYLSADGSINVPTQSAQALALFADLVPAELRDETGAHLAKMIAENGNHMSTGFLGTRPLLPVLSSAGQHDLSAFLFQSHEFPSWGYEIDNGATTIWERWDSFTKEDAFGRHNAAMNSFSHYAFGAVCEWMFKTLAGIQSDGPGYEKIIIRPMPPAPGSNAMHEPIQFVDASYDSIRGLIRSSWRANEGSFSLDVTIPANTTATVFLPSDCADMITESGKPLSEASGIIGTAEHTNQMSVEVGSGTYHFEVKRGLAKAKLALKTSKPMDMSINPEKIDMTKAKEVARWDFNAAESLATWATISNVVVEKRQGKTFLVASGHDSQMITSLSKPVSGRLVIELRANPGKGATSQFFWASSTGGFNSKQNIERVMSSTDQINAYLFRIPETGPIQKLRFDPFATFDEYAQRGEMQVESITIFDLSE